MASAGVEPDDEPQAETPGAPAPVSDIAPSSDTVLADMGGDPVCWAPRVCPECGLFVPVEPPTVCPRCGTVVGIH